jgi:hypothetical protein
VRGQRRGEREVEVCDREGGGGGRGGRDISVLEVVVTETELFCAEWNRCQLLDCFILIFIRITGLLRCVESLTAPGFFYFFIFIFI